MNLEEMKKMFVSEDGAQKLEENLLDLDSEFRFKCRRCGKCCKNQNTIIFTPKDVFNIAHKQGKTMMEVIEAYTEVYIGHGSRMPIVHLLPKGPKNTCPLLGADGRCSVHDCKPTVCALYPLGRVVVADKAGAPLTPESKRKVRYILNDCSCGSAKRINTVRSWLARFGIPEQDEFFMLWNGAVVELATTIRRFEEQKIPGSVLEMLWNLVFEVLYVNCDTTREFLPQFKASSEKLLSVFREFERQVNAEDEGG